MNSNDISRRAKFATIALMTALCFPTQLLGMLISLSPTNGAFVGNGVFQNIMIQDGGTLPVNFFPTESQTYMSIDGPGWFVIRDPISGMHFITRRGDFRIDSNNFLITSRGMRVQGFNTLDTTATGPRGDIQIEAAIRPATTSPTAIITAFRVETDGSIWVSMSDGTEYLRAQILLQQIGRPDNIQRIYHDAFLAEADAMPAAELKPPGSDGLGLLIPSVLSQEKLPPQLTLLPRLEKPRITDEGVVTHTMQTTDLAIRGPGAFIVRDPATSELFATRAGMFVLDRDGYITTYDGKRLQGLGPSVHAGVRDIQIGLVVPTTTSPTAEMTTYSIDINGGVSLFYTDGTAFTEAQILLYNFRQPELLTPTRLGQFSGVAAAQPYVVEDVGQYGRGKTRIQGGAIELVNVTYDLLQARQTLSFFPQGALYRSTNQTHLAIDGAGFFLVKHPLTGEQFVTRRGDFHLDSSGYLVNAQAMRVQGISDVALNRLGDLRPSGMFAINRLGEIYEFLSDGTQRLQGQILLYSFKEPHHLRPVGDGLYSNLQASAPNAPAIPGTHAVGVTESSALEKPPEPESLQLPERRGTRMKITGEPGSRWTIQAKDGRSKWKTIGVITNAPFEVEFADRTSKHNRNRTYRVLAEYPEP